MTTKFLCSLSQPSRSVRPSSLLAAYAIAAVATFAGCDKALGPSSPSPMPNEPAAPATSAPPPEEPERPREVDAGPVPPISCGTPSSERTHRSELADADPDYARELAELDLESSEDPFDLSKDDGFTQALIRYMLQLDEETRSIPRATMLGIGDMGKAVLAARLKGTAGESDFDFLRRGLHHFYPCTRPIPGSLDELRRRFGDYESWDTTSIACSRPKNAPRRIRSNEAAGVFIAEAIIEGEVRETEVIFSKLRGDGQLDFAAYTAQGTLTDTSPFATAGGDDLLSSAPYTCMACHIDAKSLTFAERSPFGTGAGCR